MKYCLLKVFCFLREGLKFSLFKVVFFKTGGGGECGPAKPKPFIGFIYINIVAMALACQTSN